MFSKSSCSTELSRMFHALTGSGNSKTASLNRKYLHISALFATTEARYKEINMNNQIATAWSWPEVGPSRRPDAVTPRVEVTADLHRVARFALVRVVILGRLDQKGVLPLANPGDTILVAHHEDGRLSSGHEGPHPLVDRYRRHLSQNKWPRHALLDRTPLHQHVVHAALLL